MEENEKIEPEYLKGFNEGYIMAQHEPELAQKIANIKTDFIRAVAFREGYQQFEKEKNRERLPSWLKQEKPSKDKLSPGKNRERDMDLDKD